MITKKSRPHPYSRSKNGKGMSNNEQTSNFEPSRHENSKPRSQNGSRNYQHLFDKYTNMAREALSCGDRVAAEFHYQHADHYLRLLNERQSHRPYAQPNKHDNRAESAIELPLENEVESSMEQEPSS